MHITPFLTLYKASDNINLLIFVVHRAIFSNVMATISSAALKASVLSAHLQETPFLPTETLQLFQSPLCWLLNTPVATAAQGPSCPFQPWVPAQPCLRPSEMTGLQGAQEQFGTHLLSISSCQARLRPCEWEGDVSSEAQAGASADRHSSALSWGKTLPKELLWAVIPTQSKSWV